MGFSFSKALGLRKINKKIFGKRDRGTWGHLRKKIGLKNPFSSSASSVYSARSLDSIYGPSGSIVGRY